MDKEVIDAFDWLDGHVFYLPVVSQQEAQRRIDLIRAYLTDPGYRRVPVEPTEAMHKIVEDACTVSVISYAEAYKAMLSASQGEGE